MRGCAVFREPPVRVSHELHAKSTVTYCDTGWRSFLLPSEIEEHHDLTATLVIDYNDDGI
jgi:hypothetical protein